MTPRFLFHFLWIAILLPGPAFAQADVDLPSGMLGFFKPGMHVGISSVEGTTSVIIRTYTADDYKIASELNDQIGRSLKSASSLAETNAAVREELDAYVSRVGVPEASRERLMVAPLIRTTFAKVVHVGDDYVLVELAEDPPRKRVIPRSSIATVYLDANPVRIFSGAAR